MRSRHHSGSRATLGDWARQPEDRRVELIDGVLVEKAAPDFPHGEAQGGVLVQLREPFHRPSGGGGGPGGWWIAPEVDVLLGESVFRPDIAGWRRATLPEKPTERPARARPDWLCEVLSESNASTDSVRKLRLYHRAGVPHYWIVDPATRTLTVFRWAEEGYLNILVAEVTERVRAEPFDAVEFDVGRLFGLED